MKILLSDNNSFFCEVVYSTHDIIFILTLHKVIRKYAHFHKVLTIIKINQ